MMIGRCFCCIVLLLLTAGCLTAPDIEKTRLYMLQPDINVPTAAPLELTLGVRPLFAARPYGLPMTFLDANQQLGYRTKEEWAEPPADTVTRALTDALAATKRFKDVGNASDMARPELLLTGELRKFYENRAVEPRRAEVEVRLELRFSRAPGAYWAQTLSETVAIQADDAPAFAAAMNEAVACLVVRAADAIAAVDPPDMNDGALTGQKR
ncbi:MAG TPA: hypothetical protein ENN29_01520 [Candidatus Hydrogenedentes bacterium]|nr:hypothetical protein [Candidatus Hydrogenedentota bacterium]